MNGQQTCGVGAQCKEDRMRNAHQAAKTNDEVKTGSQADVDAYQNRQ